MKHTFVFMLFVALTAIAGCGGHAIPPPPPVADASGTWQGTFTSNDKAPKVSKVTISFTQGTQGTDSAGFLFAPLSARLNINSPDCPAVVAGTGSGTITGSRVDVTLALSDGGSLHISGEDNAQATPNQFVQTTYAFTSGTCAPQAGAVAASKQ